MDVEVAEGSLSGMDDEVVELSVGVDGKVSDASTGRIDAGSEDMKVLEELDEATVDGTIYEESETTEELDLGEGDVDVNGMLSEDSRSGDELSEGDMDAGPFKDRGRSDFIFSAEESSLAVEERTSVRSGAPDMIEPSIDDKIGRMGVSEGIPNNSLLGDGLGGGIKDVGSTEDAIEDELDSEFEEGEFEDDPVENKSSSKLPEMEDGESLAIEFGDKLSSTGAVAA